MTVSFVLIAGILAYTLIVPAFLTVSFVLIFGILAYTLIVPPLEAAAVTAPVPGFPESTPGTS